MVKVVKILGANYKVLTDVPRSKDPELAGLFGYCSYGDHRIVVVDLNTVDNWKNESGESKLRQKRATLRHEVIHAFLYESGLYGSSADVNAWSQNEEMVDWFALQFPKMLKVFEQLDCVEV